MQLARRTTPPPHALVATRTSCLALVCVVLLLLPTTAAAQDAPVSGARLFGGDNLAGLRGLARTVAASNNNAGYIAVGTNLEFFAASEFIRDSTTTTTLYDHSRFDNTYTIAIAPLRFIEVALALHVISDSTSGGGLQTDELQVAVGDPQLAVKGGFAIMSGFSVGALVDARFASGAGFFQAALDTTILTMAALASYTLPSLPLTFHLNAGFVLDGSENLIENSNAPSYERFAAQASSFNRVLLRVGAEYATRYVGPFFEWSMEPFVGDGNPGVSGSPMRLTLGARGWLGERKGLQLMAAIDIGLLGTGPRDPGDVGAGKDAFTVPTWNLMLRASYRFDPFYEPPAKVVTRPIKTPDVKGSPKLAALTGAVLDARSGKPVWNARVRVGSDVSWLAVDPQTGQFRSYNVEVSVAESMSAIEVKLSPSAEIKPGTIRGTVGAIGGRRVHRATVLIPELDKTIKPNRRGKFSIDLKPGEYNLVVSARGYRTQKKSIRVVEGETVILNVELHK
ncbi:MAG: hypothetical protein CSB49_08340 [Proteobacteria bacterium]|nr:MAG: hypothetical protein CSB49_08340 [Pseudomonadota bacterium]